MSFLENAFIETAVKTTLSKKGVTGKSVQKNVNLKTDVRPEYKKCFSDEDLHKLESYFWKPGDLFMYLMKKNIKFSLSFIAGIVLLFVFGIGLLVLGYTAYLFYKEWMNLPTDEEFDALKKKAFKTLDTISLEKLGLDKSDTVRNNEVVSGPKYTDGIYKVGKDGYVRYRSYWILVSNFTKKQLATYKCSLDLVTGQRYSESTDEFFYKDIVSVGTKENDDGWTNFELRNSGGGNIEIPLFSDNFSNEIGGKFEATDADKVINNIRAIVRGNK